jgi:hypothetical protein
VSQAPAWLSYAAPIVAAVALFVSVGTYRRAGPRIRAKLTVSPLSVQAGVTDDFMLALTVTNKGLAPVDLKGFYLGISMLFLNGRIWEYTNEDIYEGENLIYRLEGGSTRSWTLSSDEPRVRGSQMNRQNKTRTKITRGKLIHLPRLLSFVVTIDLGNGVQVNAPLSILQSFRYTRWAGTSNAAHRADLSEKDSRKPVESDDGSTPAG